MVSFFYFSHAKYCVHFFNKNWQCAYVASHFVKWLCIDYLIFARNMAIFRVFLPNECIYHLERKVVLLKLSMSNWYKLLKLTHLCRCGILF